MRVEQDQMCFLSGFVAEQAHYWWQWFPRAIIENDFKIISNPYIFYNLAKEILATNIFDLIYRCDGWNWGCSNSIWWKEFLLVLLRSYCCVVVCDDFGYDVGWELYLTTCGELRCWWCYHGRPCNDFNLCFLCRNDLSKIKYQDLYEYSIVKVKTQGYIISFLLIWYLN